MVAAQHNPYFAVEEEISSPWLRWLRQHLPSDPPPFRLFVATLVAAVPLLLAQVVFGIYLVWRSLEFATLGHTLPAALLSTFPFLAWFAFFTAFCHHRKLWWAPTTLLAMGYAFYAKLLVGVLG
jgi:hypothetical protein